MLSLLHISLSFLLCMFECRIFFSIIIIKISPHEMSRCLTLFVSCLKCSDHILSTIFGHVLLARNFPSNMQLLLPLFSCFGFLWGAVSWCWVFCFVFFPPHLSTSLPWFHPIILLPRPQLKWKPPPVIHCLCPFSPLKISMGILIF